MREEHHGLVNLALALGVQLVDHHGQGHRDHDVQYNEHQIVQQGVAQQHAKGIVVDEEFEVVKSHPITHEQVGQKGLPREDLIFLESNDEAKHGQVAEQHVPNEGR